MINPNEVYQELTVYGEAWSEANATADWMEETKKVVLSQMMTKFEGSIASKEMQALASQEYQDHIQIMTDARKHANIAKVNYEAKKMWAELLRTKAATERAANKYAT